jgi:hypothetical protein
VRHSSRMSAQKELSVECSLEGEGGETWFFGVAWRVGWAAETSVEGEEGYIANFPGIFFGEERGVVGLCVLGKGSGRDKPAWLGRRWRCRGALLVDKRRFQLRP